MTDPVTVEELADCLAEAEQAGYLRALGELAGTLPAAPGGLRAALWDAARAELRIALAGSVAGDTLLTAERWRAGDQCVFVLGIRSLTPASMDETSLAVAVRGVVADARSKEGRS